MSWEEHRKHRRVLAVVPVLVVGELFQEKGHTLNLSAGGCVIAAAQAPEKGQHLHLMLQVPNLSMPIKVQLVVVRWKSHDLFGVEFIRLSPLDQKGLQRYLHMIDLSPSSAPRFH